MMTEQHRTGIVLFQLGGPDSLDAVEPFLFNLFCDPDIINFPLSGLVRRPLARLISRKRAPYVAEHYRHIGGKSPIREITEAQAAALEERLGGRERVRAVVAMRYWKPSTLDAVETLGREGITDAILLPLYPHYSITTTGSSIHEWERTVRQTGAKIRTQTILNYYDHPAYLRSVAKRIEEGLLRFPAGRRERVHLLFSAHGTPLKLVAEGDPYKGQIEETVRGVLKTGGFRQPHSLAFQSRVGPQKWIPPFTADVVRRLGGEGVKELLVIPIAFVSDHIETLYELNVEVREFAVKAGIGQFEVTEGLNTSETFIAALEDLVRRCLREEHILRP